MVESWLDHPTIELRCCDGLEMQSETRLLGSSILRFLYHLRRRRWPRKLVKIHFCLFVWFLCPKQQKTRPIEK